MPELTRDVCARVGMRWSLVFAVLGVLAAFLLLVLLKIQALITEPAPESLSGIVVGLTILCLSAALLGRLAGRIVYLSGNKLAVNLVIGVVLALVCLIISAVAGCAVGALLVISKQPSFVWSTPLQDIALLSLLILFYGGAPAALLGLLYGALVKVTLDRKLKHKPVAPTNQQAG
ncbi:MAG TPA: hypothetical protein VKC61_24940 [Pyrinomonadaceae bacterium]|nr:hypothetical protein [Pyrinomonadaceae bacterium]